MSASALDGQSIASAGSGERDLLCRFTAALSIAALLVVVAVRVAGPSDLYDQTQPKTVSYTTDMLVHGGTHWILPIERGELPATKPPLYNWLAAPAVKMLGFESEIGHKLPSVLAMLVCWVLLVRIGRALDGDGMLGWLAGLCFICNYAIFKLGYLARPDMVLTMWTFVAWACGTAVIIRAGQDKPTGLPHGLTVVLWLAIAAAALTKGPVALIPVAAVVLCTRVVAGRFSAIGSIWPVTGCALAMSIFGAWVWAVWRIDPVHLHDELWFNEVYGRITGTGDEGTRGGTRSLLRELPYQSLYFLSRFAPWSLFAVVAMASMIAPARTLHSRAARWLAIHGGNQAELPWMRSSAIMVVLTISVFSLSVGKRADYIAIALPQGALLAAWALLRIGPRLAISLRWFVPIAAMMTITALASYDRMQLWAPQRGFGDDIQRFAHQVVLAMRTEPAPVLHCSAGRTHLQAMLGLAGSDGRQRVGWMIARGEPFWVVAGRTLHQPDEFDHWLMQRGYGARAEPRVRSAELPRAKGWPEQVTLWRITPHPSSEPRSDFDPLAP